MELILSYFGANEKGEEMELGGRIATASVRTGFAMTGFLQGGAVVCKKERRSSEERCSFLLFICF